MWSEDDGPFDGRRYRLARTLNAPAPLSRPRPYLLVAGGGEKRTLALVARYADACNIFGTGGAARRKLEILWSHCEAVGRDPAEIEATTMLRIDAATSRGQLLEQVHTAHDAGIEVAYLWARHPQPRQAVELISSVVADAEAW